MENGIQRINEIKFIQKIIEDNSIYNETKVKYNMFFDPLAKVLFNIIGIKISRLGEFRPLLHLQELCNDEIRVAKFNNLGYPFKMTNDPNDLVNYLASFSDENVKPSTLETFITDEFLRYKLDETSLKIKESIYDSTKNVRSLLVHTSIELDNLLCEAQDDVIVKDGSQLVDDMISYLNNPDVESYINTGIDIIDQESGGTPKEALISIVACSKMGKSMVLIDSCLYNLSQGRSCVFFSIEMSEEQVFQRMIARYLQFDVEKIAKKEYNEEEKRMLIEGAMDFKERFGGLFEIYQNKNGMLVKNIEAHISRKIKAGQKVDDIFVDYLQILDEATKQTKVEKMEELPKQLRVLKQKLGLRIFVPAQLNTSAKTKTIEEITEDDLNWAKNLARECDVLIALHRHPIYKLTQMKYILARIKHTDETYFFPEANLNIAKFGAGHVWDETMAEQIAIEKGLYSPIPKKKNNTSFEEQAWV